MCALFYLLEGVTLNIMTALDMFWSMCQLFWLCHNAVLAAPVAPGANTTCWAFLVVKNHQKFMQMFTEQYDTHQIGVYGASAWASRRN